MIEVIETADRHQVEDFNDFSVGDIKNFILCNIVKDFV